MAFLGELLLLLEPLAIGYVLYVCYLLGNVEMLVGAYLTIHPLHAAQCLAGRAHGCRQEAAHDRASYR